MGFWERLGENMTISYARQRVIGRKYHQGIKPKI